MSAQPNIPRPEKQSSIPFSTVLLLLALLIAILAAWPLIGEPGFLNTRGGGDSPFLLQRLQQLETAVRDGHFPVRWMPDANYGYGYPFFNYYAPLSIYIAAAFRFLGFSIVQSIELAQMAGFLAAAWGMFLLARRWLGSAWAGFLASVAYTMAPFHLVNIYVRGDSLAEFWAMAWYPWILISVDYLLENKKAGFPYGRVAVLAVAYTALILSHNISALIFSPFLLLYLLLRGVAWRRSAADKGEGYELYRRQGKIWLAVFLAILLALGLAAWFFIPALAEQDLAQLDPVTSGFFHYSNHFRGFDLVQPSLNFDYSVAGGRAFRLGFVQAVLAMLGVLTLLYFAFWKRVISVPIVLFILCTVLVATFMITPLSRLLWDYLPLLSFTQFPWRFLSVQAFGTALVTAVLALLPARRMVVPTAAALLILSSMARLQTDQLLLTDEDMTAQRLGEYEWFSGNIGSTVSAEYLPLTVEPRPYTSRWINGGRREDLRILEGELLQASPQALRTSRQSWQLTTADSGATVVFPTLYWPGWRAVVDDQVTPVTPSPGAGLIMLALAPGEHQVELQLVKTTPRQIGELISLLAVLLTLFALFKARRLPRLTPARMLPFALLVVTLIAMRLWPQEPLSAANMTWDFAQMGYLHHDDDGVLFDNGIMLHSYEYDREHLAAGDELTITVLVSGASDEEITVSLGRPSSAWPVFDPEPPAIARQSQRADGDRSKFKFTLPDNVPEGLVLPWINIAGAKPLTPSGGTRGELYLRPLRITNRCPAAQTGPELDVRAVDVRALDEERLEVELVWTTRRQLSHNYNLSLRLQDSDGHWLSQLDAQPGYGFLPSSGWPVGMEVNDWLTMSLPQDLPRETVLPLVVRLYEVGSDEVVLSRRLGDIVVEDEQLNFHRHEPVFDLPDEMQTLPITFGDAIRLQGYQIDQSGSELSLTLYWEALSGGQPDYTRFIHLFDPQTGEITLQADGQPRNDSYPTSQWTAGEIVTDTTVFDMSDAAPGNYQLGTGFYRQEGESLLHLLPVELETQLSYETNRVDLPDLIEWEQIQD